MLNGGINVYIVEYDANGGEGRMAPDVFTLGYSYNLAANAFSREGYISIGWAASEGGSVEYTGEAEVLDLCSYAGGTVTLYAVWKSISYTVEYNANGGHGEMEKSTFNYNEAQDLRKNAFLMDGYVFAGWSTTKNGDIEWANEGSILNLSNIQGDIITLYAIWGINIFTVSYIANGGSGYMAPGIVTLGEEFTLAPNAFTQDGYFFAGWSLLNNGEVHLMDEDIIDDTDDITGETIKLYAVWMPVMAVTWPHELYAYYGQTLADVWLSEFFYSTIPGTCAWAEPASLLGNAGVYMYSMIFTPEDLVNYTAVTQEVEITVYPRLVEISGTPGRTLIPFDSAEPLYGRTATLEITLNGLLNGDVVTLAVSEGYGLSLTGNAGIGNNEKRTINVSYNETTINESGLISLELYISGNDNYALCNAAEFELTMLDGKTESRAIPVTQGSFASFNAWANSGEGLERHYKLLENINLDQGSILEPLGTIAVPFISGIDVSGYAASGFGISSISLDQSSNWEPIGTNADPFTGSFDGNGFTVSNLSINSTASYQGMFGCIGTGGSVKNTALMNANVKGANYTGGLAGHSSGIIEGCYTTGSVSGGSCQGGIAGLNSGTVRNSYSTSSVTGGSLSGGIAGLNDSIIQNCYATGRITGTNYIGGIAGLNSMGTIRDCAALNSIIITGNGASTGIGRITGYSSGGTMSCNYARSDMMVKNNWNGTNGTNKTITGTGTHSGIDGYGISLEQLGTQSLWGTASNWTSAGAWNFAEVWELNANNMPKLMDADGNQTHALPLGDGTEADPFRVYNEATLRKVGTGTDGWVLDKQYLQIQDITLPLPVAGQSNWTAIGTDFYYLTGVYDGSGHVIINLVINSTAYLQGMFGQIGPGGIVKNLGLIGGSVKGGTYTGSVAGWNAGTMQNCYSTGNVSGTVDTGGIAGGSIGIIEGCYSTGSISGGESTGGVIGNNTGTAVNCYSTGIINGGPHSGGVAGTNSGTLQGCHARGAVSGSKFTGGVAGMNSEAGKIQNCYSTGSVSGGGFTGGVAGNNVGLTECCYSTGSVSGDNDTGGLAGRNIGTVQNCYTTGNVSGSSFTGGIVGLNDDIGTLQNCYATGNISGGIPTGGVAGDNSGTLRNCVALNMIITTSGIYASIGRVTSYFLGSSLSNNYARGDMAVMYNWNGSSGTGKTIDEGLTTIDGASIGQWDFNAPSWWQNEYIWTRGGAYNFTDTWEMNKNNLPVLKNMGNIQDHSVLAADGSATNPFLVYDVNTLKKVGSGTEGWALNKHYRQIQNITLPPPAAGQSNWTAIGTSSVPFTGGFDGNGCTVSNLAVNSTAAYQGMFGYIGTGGALKNLGLVNASVSGGNYTGSFAGYTGGTVQECYVTGSVSGGSYTGGIVGYSTGTVQNCYSSSSVSGGGNVGGIVGQNDNIVKNCYATGKVTGTGNAGGVVGSGAVQNCVALNSIVTTTNGSSTVGRIAGNGGGSNNRAREKMAVKYNWKGLNGTDKTINTGLTTVDGTSISAASWNNTAFWQNTAAWNFSAIWMMNVNNLPALKNLNGTQDHALDNDWVVFMEMKLINAGSFTMGSPANEEGRFTDEGPRHTVTLSEFNIGKYPVTQKQYQTVTGVNPSGFTAAVAGENRERLPVEMVTWYDAVEFCNKLSVLEGFTPVYAISGRTPASGYPITNAIVTANLGSNGYRLPTEAQWEFACRAGTTDAYNNGSPDMDVYSGWYIANSMNTSHEVGKKQRNRWELYDMHGNVWEWCWDWFGNYTSTAQTNPTGASSGKTRVNRGGSWYSAADSLRSACRNGDLPNNQFANLGFRVVRP